MVRLVWLFISLACLTACQTKPAPQQLPETKTSAYTSHQSSPGNAFRPALNRVSRRLAQGTSSSASNEVLLLESGQDALTTRLHLIDQAQHSLEYQTFIWANDEAGQLLANTLIRAAQRGVKVRILVDYIGIAKDAQALAQITRAHPNLEVRVYRPTASTLERGHFGSIIYALTNFKGANQRMHHKVVVADDHLGITGGRNVENTYFDHGASMNFKDRDALVVGPVAQTMREAFDSFWSYRHTLPAIQLRDVASATTSENNEYRTSATGRKLTAVVRRSKNLRSLARRLRSVNHVEFISDLPGKNGALSLSGGGRATHHVLRALDEATSEVWIQTPYMVLGRKGRSYFSKFKKRHPDVAVHISTNSFGSTDNLVAYAGNVRLRDRYIHEFGFNLQEYRPLPRDLRRVLPTYDWLVNAKTKRPPFLCLHAKSFVVDDNLAFVGSFNLDPRSAHLNTECGFIIRDSSIATELKREIQRDMRAANSWTIAPRALLKDLVDVHMLSKGLTDLSPLDISLLDATSAFELKPGRRALSKEDPNFYRDYRDIGSFPGSPGTLSDRELKMRLLKFTTPIFDPLL